MTWKWSSWILPGAYVDDFMTRSKQTDAKKLYLMMLHLVSQAKGSGWQFQAFTRFIRWSKSAAYVNATLCIHIEILMMMMMIAAIFTPLDQDRLWSVRQDKNPGKVKDSRVLNEDQEEQNANSNMLAPGKHLIVIYLPCLLVLLPLYLAFGKIERIYF